MCIPCSDCLNQCYYCLNFLHLNFGSVVILTLNNDQLLEEEVAKLTSQINMNQEDPNVYDLCRRGAILRRVSDIFE